MVTHTLAVRAQIPSTSPTPFTRPRTAITNEAKTQTPATIQPAQKTAAPMIVPTPSTPTTPISAPQTNVVVPQIPSAVPLQPVRPLAINKFRASVTEAERILKTRVTPAAMNPSLYFVTLAVLDPDSSNLHLLTLSKQTLLTAGMETTLPSSLGTLLRIRIVRPNYVNTAVIVSDLSGRQFIPLVLEYPIEKGGVFKEMAYYTSAHPALMSPELVKTGQAYVHTMIDLAAKRLKERGVIVSPQMLDTAERLCLVEHIDHDRFRKENRIALYEEVYSLYALNELDTFKYSVSLAGAGGMVQMIPWTYQMIRQRHSAVGLNPDFVAGMRNHGNALEAMLLYMQDTWNDLAVNPDITNAMATGIANQTDLLAAGYNSNPAKLASYIRRGGEAWRTLIPRETQTYLQIYHSIDSLVQFKAREKNDE